MLLLELRDLHANFSWINDEEEMAKIAPYQESESSRVLQVPPLTVVSIKKSSCNLSSTDMTDVIAGCPNSYNDAPPFPWEPKGKSCHYSGPDECISYSYETFNYDEGR